MMIRTRLTTFSAAAIAIGAIACGSDDPPTNMTQQPIQCETATYVAFDPANHANQDRRVQAYEDMLTAMKAAETDPTMAAAKFAEAENLYMTTAELRTKVQGRKDMHLAGDPVVGPELDAAIMAGFAEGKQATTALEANVARQKVDKTMVHFFFLSIYYEMEQGKRKNWDEAYGYYAAGAENAEANRKGFAKVATKRDTTNGTSLSSDIFNALIDGSCELERALRAQNVEAIEPAMVAPLATIVEKADLDMQKVLAFSAGHEAFEIDEIQEDMGTMPTQEQRDEMKIKLAELEPYFRSIEAIMLAKGGESAARAMRIRSAINSAKADTTEGWMLTMDAASIVADLEAEYSIDIKG